MQAHYHHLNNIIYHIIYQTLLHLTKKKKKTPRTSLNTPAPASLQRPKQVPRCFLIGSSPTSYGPPSHRPTDHPRTDRSPPLRRSASLGPRSSTAPSSWEDEDSRGRGQQGSTGEAAVGEAERPKAGPKLGEVLRSRNGGKHPNWCFQCPISEHQIRSNQ